VTTLFRSYSGYYLIYFAISSKKYINNIVEGAALRIPLCKFYYFPIAAS